MYTLLVAGIFLTTLTTAYEANRKCEPNRAALCKNLYNSTRFPNFVKHRSQVDAIIELNQYKQLIDIECAPHLRLFLCSVLMPMCTMLEENILPCRSLCEESKAGCETVLLNFVGLPWPDRLKCDQFPVSGSGQVCVENKNAQPNKKTWDYQTKINKKCRVHHLRLLSVRNNHKNTKTSKQNWALSSPSKIFTTLTKSTSVKT
uniref:FZ domain-containing protein n=1 Tax=Clytia hemisphaerica TaxID=252671 RepID=A0A7M5WUC4_9CNID